MQNTHEQKFFNALRDIFVGARIEGESGYINLMRMKSRYYETGVFPKLMEMISEELAPFPAFREELFDKLYNFFKRYFSESGSIYFRHTPYHQNIFERIYTDDRDVMLFWKTQNLYYVKTDRLFRSLTLSLNKESSTKHTNSTKKDDSSDSWTDKNTRQFSFDASDLQNKRNNEKRSLIFEYKGIGKNEILKFAVNYSQGATKTKIDDILKAIKKDGVKVNEDQLTRAFRLFERQSEVDFFINKNARTFLEEQFDLWMYQYLFKRESEFNEMRIKQMQILKRVAFRIIEFISQFEDELVRIWNKPKFALSSNYVITFDHVFGKSEDVARKLLAHEGITAQIEEWRELGMIDEDFAVERIFEQDEEEKPKAKKKKVKENTSLFDKELSEDEKPSTNYTKDTKNNFDLFRVSSCDSWTEKENLSTNHTKSTKKDSFDSWTILSAKYRYLPFDTKHFKSLEIEILSLFDNLDEELDGRLIHSENYQALNTLKDKFREKVKCIYIDPPYNATSSEIIYENTYKHASWLSLIENRVSIAKNILAKDGVLTCTIDENERERLGQLLESLFPEHKQTCITVIHNPGGIQGDNFSYCHEYAFFVYPRIGKSIGLQKRDDEGADVRPLRDVSKGNHLRENAANCFYPIYVEDGKVIGFGDVSDDSYHPESVNVVRDDGIMEIYPIDAKGNERKWVFARQTVESIIDELEVGFNNKRKIWDIIRTKKAFNYKTVWTNGRYNANAYGAKLLGDILPNNPFSFPKSLYTVMDSVDAVVQNEKHSFVLDFFGGSGTTAHAVINLNREDNGRRKYILVEANDYFHTVILPRVKKVIFSDKWKDGTARADSKGISHFCKYFALEQYEDTLRRAVYVNDKDSETPSFFDNPYESPFASYVFLRDKKMSDALEVDNENNKISVDFAKLYEDIDLAETLSCVKGKFIKSVTAESVTFAVGETIN